MGEDALSPPVELARSPQAPPLPFAPESFDLVLSMSVISHLVDDWAAWMLDLRRVLAPGGLLLTTIISAGYSRTLTGEPWDEMRVGMNVLGYGAPRAAGGPMILHTGARPVFVDCDREAMTIDPERVAAALTPRTRAILPAHFAGRPCAMRPLLDLARLHGLRLVEDCAHAIETRWNGTPAGLIGDVGCFSFYVTKNVAAAEGGMLLTREPELAARAKTLSLHGLTADAWSRFADQGHRHYQVVEPGFKYNLTDVHARLSRCISSRAWRQTTPGGRRSGRATRRPSRASRSGDRPSPSAAPSTAATSTRWSSTTRLLARATTSLPRWRSGRSAPASITPPCTPIPTTRGPWVTSPASSPTPWRSANGRSLSRCRPS